MGNVTLPTPVAAAGGALCLLGGYLLGIVAGPSSPERTTASVESYRPATGELCLIGDEVEALEGAGEDGRLCGLWRRTEGSRSEPEPGDTFRFVSIRVDDPPDEASVGSPDGAPTGAEGAPATVIYGDVVP